MPVVYIVSLFPCWSETFIVREIRELIRLGVDVRIISLKQPSERMVQSDAAALLDRVLYPVAPLQNALTVLRALATNPASTLRMLARILRCFARRPLPLVKTLIVWWQALGLVPRLQQIPSRHLHAHWATYPSTAALVLAERLRIPFSFTSHAHDIFLEHHLLAQKLHQALFSVTISQYNKRYLEQRVHGAHHDRIKVIHCGVSLDDYAFRPTGREPGRLLAVGRLDAIKGFPFLIDACGILAARGHAFACDIIGEGPLGPALTRQIARLGLEQRVRVRPAMAQEEVRRHLYRAHVFILPSVRTPHGDMDGIPVALIEAMAVGTPVVSTTVSGIPELIEDGVSGLLAPPGDPEALAARIEQLLGDSQLITTLAHNARVRIERDFDLEKEARKLYHCFTDSNGDSNGAIDG